MSLDCTTEGLLSAERLLTLAQLSHLLPQRPHPSTIYRWITRGIRGNRLNSYKIGNQRVVTLADAEAFFAACSTQGSSSQTPCDAAHAHGRAVSPRTTRQCHRRALKALDDRGV